MNTQPNPPPTCPTPPISQNRYSSPHCEAVTMNLSFAGCGFLGIYHVGVAVAFKKYAPHLLLEKIGGASAGALAATCLLCDMPLGELTSDFFRVVNEARSHSLKAFSPSFNIQNCLLEGLEKFLPANAHELVNGKLHISLTRFWGRKNVIVSHFDSREELLQALLCACWIPVFSGYFPPKFRGVSYMDGAFSDNLPVLDENTITVSPFCGESDICPRDDSAQLFHVNLANTSIEVSMENMGRLRRILVPCLPEELSDMCQQGFDDALQFLHRNDLISCTRCLAVQSTFVVQETIHDPRKKHFDPKCVECVKHRASVLDGNKMPETVLTVFQTYIESANIGLAKWIFRNRGWRLLETLSLPATVPADMICATLTNIVGDSMERRQLEMWVLSNYINQSQPVLPMHAHRHRYVEGLADLTDTDEASSRLSRLLSHWSRLLATTPCIRERFWHVADFLIDQINALNSLVQSQRTQKMTANISCQLSLTECGKQKVKAMTHRSSKLDILINDNEIVSTIDRQQSAHHHHHQHGKHSTNAATSPRGNSATAGEVVVSSTTPMSADDDNDNEGDHDVAARDEHYDSDASSTSGAEKKKHHHHHQHNQGDVDSFDHILQTTSHHEAVYAYYYMDENHKVKVTEIFDMTDNEDPDLQTINERALNQQLQFDASEWDARPTADHMYAESALGGDDHVDARPASPQQHHHHNQQQWPSQQAQRMRHSGRRRSSSSSSSSSSSTSSSTTTASNADQRYNADDADLDVHQLVDYDDLLSNVAGDYTPDSVHLVQNYRDNNKGSSNQSYSKRFEDDGGDSFAIGATSSSTPVLASWSDEENDDDVEERNCSDPEVDQMAAASSSSSAAVTSSGSLQISERANRALSRSSQLHLMF